VFQCAQARATVVGLGATGLSLARYLARRGARVTVIDGSIAPAGLEQLRTELPDLKFAAIDVGRDELPIADFVALSPGVPRASYAVAAAVARGVPVVGDIEIFAQDVASDATVVAITGSNGKTTTTALAGELLKTIRPDTQVAGNIGTPILDALGQAPTCSTWVLELSSFQLESTSSLRLASAAVINVTDNHLDRYPSFFAYAAAKERIFHRASDQVLNRADMWSMSMRRSAEATAATFGPDRPSSGDEFGVGDVASGRCLMHGDEDLLPASEIGVSGAHNVQNALAALAITRRLPIQLAHRQRVLREFRGMPHRCQQIAFIDGVHVIDDSKATTVVATNAALDGLARPTWLIAGGDAKGQDMTQLARAAAGWCQLVCLIGRDAGEIAAALSLRGVAWRRFDTLQDATYAALDGAVAGGQVLLSPACASWDMFRNYGHRAQVFADAVRSWAVARGKAASQIAGLPV